MPDNNELTARTTLVESKRSFGIISKALRDISFAFYYPKFVATVYNDKVATIRRDVFASIDTIVPSDTQDGRLKILEIGSGPGFNFDYFPKQCRYTALDKNAHFKNVLLNNLQKLPGIVLENLLTDNAENISSITSNSVDVVISSHLHCSVDNSQEVFKEINRVLVPGGCYYFFEHVLDEPSTFRYRWQKLFNKIGLWKFVGNGCTFVNLEEEISKSNLVKCNATRFVCTNDSWKYYAIYLVASHFIGHAEKAK